MMNINILVAQELYSLGFTYTHYEKHFYKGMVFQLEDTEYVLGGDVTKPLTFEEQEVVQNGTWLPSVMHLIEWLNDNEFSFAIICQDDFFEIQCKDSITGREYQAKTPTLDFSLAVIIKKILKRNERKFDYTQKVYGEIIKETQGDG